MYVFKKKKLIIILKTVTVAVNNEISKICIFWNFQIVGKKNSNTLDNYYLKKQQ